MLLYFKDQETRRKETNLNIASIDIDGEREGRTTSLLMTSVGNTPGTAGGPGGRDRTLAVKSLKKQKKSTFFRKKIKIT